MLKLFINFSKVDSTLLEVSRDSEDILVKTKNNKQAFEFSRRNRRLYDRYDLSKTLSTLHGISEYCFVCDLSENGLSAILSENFSSLLGMQKIIEATVKVRNMLIDLRLRVVWKSQSIVGFSFVELSNENKLSLQKIMRPLRIASSIKKFESNAIFNSRFIDQEESFVEWYHGEDECELYLWKNKLDQVEAFQLSVGNLGIRWSELEGLKTGSVSTMDERGRILNPNEILWFVEDKNENKHTKEFCLDLLASLSPPLGPTLELSLQKGSTEERGEGVRYGA